MITRFQEQDRSLVIAENDPSVLAHGASIAQSLAAFPKVLWKPSDAFCIARSSRYFFVVWLLGIVIRDVRLYAIYHRVGVDALVRYSVAQSPVLTAPSAIELAQVKEWILHGSSLQMVTTPAAWTVQLLLLATIFLAVDHSFLGYKHSYREMLSVITYAQAPLIFFWLGTALFLWIYPDPHRISVASMLGTGADLFVGRFTAYPFARAVFTRLDLWKLWSLWLIGIGCATKREDIRKTLGCAATIWLLATLAEGILATFIAGSHSFS